VCDYYTLIVILHSAYGNRTLRVKINLVAVVITFVRRNHTRECHNHTHTCQNPILRVEITLMHVEITVERVKITLRLEITFCVYKSHLCVSFTRISVKITLV
jgi:hypothetical protein